MREYALQWLVTTPLYNIGEHAYYISKEYKAEHSDIPWGMISGLRHRLVHDYDGTNWSIISDVVFEELPAGSTPAFALTPVPRWASVQSETPFST